MCQLEKEADNDHLVLPGSLEYNKVIICSPSLVDTGATGYAFIDDLFAQQHSFPRYLLPEPRSLQGFDGQPAKSGPITHFCRVRFNVPGGEPEDTSFLITSLPQFAVVLGLPWLRSHRAIIDLNRNRLVFAPEATCSSPEIQASPVPSPSVPAATVPAPPMPSPTKPLEVYAIGSAPFVRLARKKNHTLFTVTLRDIEKALVIKPSVDPAAILPPEYHDFLDVFSREASDTLPEHRPYDHKIQLEPGKTPGFGPLYGMSQDELRVLKKYLEDNLAKGFIRSSSSSAASPVLFVRKPGGDLRFCVDYRGLNAITVKNRYPLPLIRETLDRLVKAQYYTKLDIIAAFNKLRMAEGEEWKTAFRTRYGLYEYLVLPFGLVNAPSSFQHYINEALHEYLDVFCTAYIDDILIYSNTRKEHTQHVRKVLERLQAAGLQVNIEKCEFIVTEVKYLGLIITTRGIKMDPDKVSAVLK